MNAAEWARFYRSRGLVVLPVIKGTKRCHVEGWQQRPPEELERMIREGDNVAIRLDGLIVLDIERPELVEVLFNGASIEQIAKKTWVSKTGKGYHIYIRGETEPLKTDGLAEIRSGRGQYVVAPPSVHPSGAQYQWLSDIEVIEISEEKPKIVNSLRRKIEVLGRFKRLIEAFVEIWRPEHRHNLALGLAGALRKSGVPQEEAELVVHAIAALAHDEEVKDRLRAVTDTYAKPLEEVAGFSRLRPELEAVLGPERAEELMNSLPQRIRGEGEGEEEGDIRKRYIHSAILNGVVLEAIGVPSGVGHEPRLLVYDGDFRVVEEFTTNGIIFRALPPHRCPYEPYVVGDLAPRTRLELIDLVFKEFETFIDAEPHEKAAATAFVLVSYVPEKFRALPFLYVTGEPGSGKTRLLELFERLCYRPLFGVTHTAADIYSYFTEGDPPMTVIEDEAQGLERDNEKLKIYKARYKRNSKVARVTVYEGGRRIDYFRSYGVTIFAAERPPENEALERRCVVIEMIEGFPEKDEFDDQDDRRHAALRSDLLKWRMRVLAGHEELPRLKLDWLRGREREIYLPLLTVLHGHRLYNVLEGFLRAKVEERQRAKIGGLPALVARVTAKIIENRGELKVPFPDLWSALITETGGAPLGHDGLSNAIVTEGYGRISRKQVGTILRNFGMTPALETAEGRRVRVYYAAPHKFRRVCRKFEIQIPPPVEKSLNGKMGPGAETKPPDLPETMTTIATIAGGGEGEKTRLESPPEPEKTGIPRPLPPEGSLRSLPSFPANLSGEAPSAPGGPIAPDKLIEPGVEGAAQNILDIKGDSREEAPAGDGEVYKPSDSRIPQMQEPFEGGWDGEGRLEDFVLPERPRRPERKRKKSRSESGELEELTDEELKRWGVTVLRPDETPEIAILPEFARPFVKRVLVYNGWRDLECRCGARFALPDLLSHLEHGLCDFREQLEKATVRGQMASRYFAETEVAPASPASSPFLADG